MATVSDMGWEAENGKCDVLVQQEGPHLRLCVCVCVGWVDGWVCLGTPGFGRAVQKGHLPGHTIYNIT